MPSIKQAPQSLRSVDVARRGRRGEARRGAARLGKARQCRRGVARRGWARQARKGVTWIDVAVMDWQGRHGRTKQANKEQTKQ